MQAGTLLGRSHYENAPSSTGIVDLDFVFLVETEYLPSERGFRAHQSVHRVVAFAAQDEAARLVVIEVPHDDAVADLDATLRPICGRTDLVRLWLYAGLRVRDAMLGVTLRKII